MISIQILEQRLGREREVNVRFNTLNKTQSAEDTICILESIAALDGLHDMPKGDLSLTV